MSETRKVNLIKSAIRALEKVRVHSVKEPFELSDRIHINNEVREAIAHLQNIVELFEFGAELSKGAE